MFTSSEANTFSLDQYLNIQTKIYSRVQDAILICVLETTGNRCVTIPNSSALLHMHNETNILCSYSRQINEPNARFTFYGTSWACSHRRCPWPTRDGRDGTGGDDIRPPTFLDSSA